MKWFYAACFSGFAIMACSYDEIKRDPDSLQCLNEYSYEKNIQFIIRDNCAYSGCHDGSSVAPGNFLDYAVLDSRIENGQFEERVLIFQDMPPPEGNPPTLSEMDLHALRCWAAQGFPEN